MMSHRNLQLISGNANPQLAEDIAATLGIARTPAKVGRFPDGEIDVRIDDNVRGSDVFLVQSTCPPVNDNLMELLILVDAARRASAARITVVIPYFGYARKDRKDEGRVPITAKLVANLLARRPAPTACSPSTCMPRRSRASSTSRWTTSTRHRSSRGTSASCACREPDRRRAGRRLLEDGPRLRHPPRRRPRDRRQASHQRRAHGDRRGHR